jgi:hypothetical protein
MFKNIERQLESQFQNDFVESSDSNLMWDSIEKKIKLKKPGVQEIKSF